MFGVVIAFTLCLGTIAAGMSLHSMIGTSIELAKGAELTVSVGMGIGANLLVYLIQSATIAVWLHNAILFFNLGRKDK